MLPKCSDMALSENWNAPVKYMCFDIILKYKHGNKRIQLYLV